jgi:hypothetical protein
MSAEDYWMYKEDGVPEGDAALLVLADATREVARGIVRSLSGDAHPYPALEAVAVKLDSISRSLDRISASLDKAGIEMSQATAGAALDLEGSIDKLATAARAK